MLTGTAISRATAPDFLALRSGGRRRAQTRRPLLARASAAPAAPTNKRHEAPQEGTDIATTVLVQFRLQRSVPFGQELLVVGDAEVLGSWEFQRGVQMKWHEGDVWEAHAELPANVAVEFKFVQQVPNSAPVWESCLNRTLAVPTNALDVEAVWSAPLATVYHDHAVSATVSEAEGEAGLTEEDVPPPFRPAEALAKFTEVVQASLDAIGSVGSASSSNVSSACDAAAAAATANGSSSPAANGSSGMSDPLAAAVAPSSPAEAAAPPASKQEHARHSLAAAVAQDVLAANQPATAAAATAEQDSKAPAAVPAALAAPAVASQAAAEDAAEKAATASKTADETVNKSGKGDAVVLPAKAEAAVGKIIDAAAAADAPAPSPPAPRTGGGSGSGGPSLKTLTQMAGTVALGVAAAGVMGALAIDITDAAVLGAVTAGAAAALSTPSVSSKRSASRRKPGKPGTPGSAAVPDSELSAGEEEAAESEQQPATIASKPSAPGVILAASVLSAIDAGKKILADSSYDEPGKPRAGDKPSPAARGKGSGKPKLPSPRK